MAKTPLFSRLLGASALSSLARREGTLELPVLRAMQRERVMARREFSTRVLKGLGAVSAARLASACGPSTADEHPSSDARIAIVGAGMAGITCAHHLQNAGVRATVYEASTRVGGRMHTARGMFPEGQVAELGGELIDTGHVILRDLAEQLGFTLDDRDAPLASGQAEIEEVWWVRGNAVPEATIVEQFSEVAALMKREIDRAESDDDYFAQLDVVPMDEWLRDNLRDQPELRSVLVNAYRGEFGLELHRQSVLNLLYMIGSDDPDPFRIFGISDERYHTREGSESFPRALADELDDAVRFEHRLVRAEDGPGDTTRLTFRTPSGDTSVEADIVVFALPFSVLRQVDLDGLSLSADKRTMIAELGYGTNAKVMGAFTRRVWLEDHRALGSVTSDEPFQQCWDTSLGQPGDSGLLTNFLGGEQGVASGDGTAERWYRDVMVAGADEVFPGAADAYVRDSAVRMHWPSQRFARGSYACYEPGQWAFWSTEGLPERGGALQFCGEHTSLENQGYMEGAAETGELVAGAILEALGKKPAERHAALLSVQRAVLQPAFGERVTLRQRRARRRELERAYAGIAAR